MVLGAEIATTGDTAAVGAVINTATAVEARGQKEVSHVPLVVGHCAFTVAVGSKLKGEFTAAHPAALLTYALTILLFVHTHVEVEAQAKLKSALQVNCVDVLPLSVLELKEIATYDPSSTNEAEVSSGAASGTASGLTENVCDACA